MLKAFGSFNVVLFALLQSNFICKYLNNVQKCVAAESIPPNTIMNSIHEDDNDIMDQAFVRSTQLPDSHPGQKSKHEDGIDNWRYEGVIHEFNEDKDNNVHDEAYLRVRRYVEGYRYLNVKNAIKVIRIVIGTIFGLRILCALIWDLCSCCYYRIKAKFKSAEVCWKKN